MYFNSIIFIFFFLPVVIGVHTVLPKNRMRNLWLLAASLLFYGWCSSRGLAFLLVYGLVNYFAAQLIAHYKKQKIWLVLGILLDVAVLFLFKYFNFTTLVINSLFGSSIQGLDLFQPMGISFVTFTTIAYIVDVYRGKTGPVANILDFYLYLSFFPKAAQGPITRYEQIGPQIRERRVSMIGFSDGMKRFIMGFGKKCLIADVLGKSVDAVFANIELGIGTQTAWIAVLCYTFQIYYDFSGYMDMAIGIGQMLGFCLPENFDRPYHAASVSEFWRRWHITLGAWFRDYIYIPLGGNRKGNVRTVVNLAVVWLVTGIWHGASFTYVLWGVYFGILVIIEKFLKDKAWYTGLPHFAKWAGTFLLVMFGWVIFRAESVAQIGELLKAMFGFTAEENCIYKTSYYFDSISLLSFVSAIVFTLPCPAFMKKLETRSQAVYCLKNIMLVLVFGASVFYLVNSTYSSFIYFQF